MVLESGLGGTVLEWARVQPAVARFTRVCSYDRAGYGWSDRSPGKRTALTIAGELETLLGHASVAAPYLLVGHSFGGLIVRILARRLPMKVAGLVLIDATHERLFEALAQAGIKMRVAPTGRRFRIDNPVMVPDNLPADIIAIARKLAGTARSVATVYGELRHMRTSTRQISALPPSTEIRRVVIAHDAPSNARTPPQILLARLWLDLQRELAMQNPQGRFLLARNSGHHVQLDRPELVVEPIRQLVLETRATQSCGNAIQTLAC